MTVQRAFVVNMAVIAVTFLALGRAIGQGPTPLPLQLEEKIPLGDVSGRIDHLAIDLARHRLFVAELGNDTVAVIDLDGRKVQHLITGLKEPQGLGYVASSDTLFVANAADGSVMLFQGESYSQAGQIHLGTDADNIRVDPVSNRVFVGYGSGALAVIDPTTNGKTADIPLPAHPESFQLAKSDRRIFVNLPKAHGVAVVDRFSSKQTASWAIESGSNFPMALDESSGRVLIASRNPAQVTAISVKDGTPIATIETCGDTDDLFMDAKRQRVYVSCGDGHLDVLEADGNSYHRAARIATVSGARTSLFVPEIDRLFVAARANPGEPAAIWVFRPTP